MKNVKSILMTTAIAASMLLSGCNGNQQNEHGDHDDENHEMMEADESHDHSQMEEHQDETYTGQSTEQMEQEQNKMHTQNHTGSFAVGDQLPNQQVCMVNDAYMGKDQIPVPVNGKTYYGCCQMCVKSLNEKETARMGTDPQTGEKVDKTEAYIVLLDKDGAVAYFKNKANADAYANK